MNSFLSGFLLGQLILIVSIFFLVKYYLLTTKNTVRKHYAMPSAPKECTSHILTRVNYDPKCQVETCDWINVLFAQMLGKFRSDIGFRYRCVKSLDSLLSFETKFMGPVSITNIVFGIEYPLLKSACIRYGESSNLRAEVQFEYHDRLSVSIETQLYLPFPQQESLCLPVSLTVCVQAISGTMTIEYTTPNDNPEETFITISILNDFRLDMEVNSILGHLTKIKDIPKLSDMAIKEIRKRVENEIVYPNFIKIRIPVLWPDAEEH